MANQCLKHSFPRKTLCPKCHPTPQPDVQSTVQNRWVMLALHILASHAIEEYVSPKGYRFKKFTRCEQCVVPAPRVLKTEQAA